jgi:hypothetical protein
VLLGGGRKWFSAVTERRVRRAAATNDYQLPVELANAWGVARGAIDPSRDLINDFVRRLASPTRPTSTSAARRLP